MAGPIYKFYRFRFTQAWYDLSPTQKSELTEKEAQLREELGVKNMVFCDSGWSNEQWAAYGVHEYPSLDVVHKHYEGMVALGMFQFLEGETMLGKQWGT